MGMYMYAFPKHKILVNISWEHDEENINIKFMKNADDIKLILHWGIFKKIPILEWHHPKKVNFPLKTKEYDPAALETEFIKDKDKEKIELTLNKDEGLGLSFVFYNPTQNIWFNNERKDFQIFFNGEETIKSNMDILLYNKGRFGYSDIFIDSHNENKMKKEILERQKTNRNKQDNIIYNKNKILEDICNYGNILKNQIKMEKILNPQRFVDINTALNSTKNDNELFALGLLGKFLQKSGIDVVIEKEKNKNENEEEKDENLTSLELITTGMTQKTKYDLHFDFGVTKNEIYLVDGNEFEKLKEKIKRKISKDYNIPKNEIIVTYPQKGSLRVQVIFENDKFNDLNLNDFKAKFKNDKEFQELNNLKEIHKDVLISVCKLSKNQLDSRGNRYDGWGENEKRGSMPYDPPKGWIGIGLNVLDKYDNGDNTWIGMENIKGEWCVAYHGVGQLEEPNKVKDIVSKIIGDKFKPGMGQVHEDCDDNNHPGKKVGKGVYCTPHIKTAEDYSGTSEINGQKYKTVLMVRVKPDAIRCCNCEYAKDYWVVDGTNNEIRPYRILYKKI